MGATVGGTVPEITQKREWRLMLWFVIVLNGDQTFIANDEALKLSDALWLIENLEESVPFLLITSDALFSFPQ